VPETPFRTALDVYAEKIGAVTPVDNPTPRMRWGLRHEPTIASAFAEETGLRVEALPPFTIYCHGAIPAQATPDRLVVADDWRVLELKAAGGEQARHWDDGVPMRYQVQVQHQLMVMGLERAYLAVLIGIDDFRWFSIDANRDFISQHSARVVEFWRQVEAREPPEPCALDVDVLRGMYPRSAEGKRIKLDDAGYEALLDSHIEAKVEAKAAEERADEAKAQLQLAMGDAEFADLPSGRSIRWRTQTRVTPPQPEKTSVTRVFTVRI
jgi:putative phage-type endonuclease